MIASAQTLRRLKPVWPFHEQLTVFGMTYGLGPCGYDVRIAENVRLIRGGFALASTIERFNMPLNLVARVHDKSTWARRGMFVQNTIIEPGWRGHLTLELAYHGPLDVLDLEHNMPIAQAVFEFLDEPTDQPYAGKYQDQPEGPQPARLDNRAAHAALVERHGLMQRRR